MGNELQVSANEAGASGSFGLSHVLLNFLGRIPRSEQALSPHPETAARHIMQKAATDAALAAGALALPPGPLGWLTILPEMLAVRKIQAQMVADISALYGSQVRLTREHMLYCLFRHTAAQVVRDLLVQVGERAVIRAVSARGMESVAQKIGVKITQRAASKGVTRWLPVIGAVGVGAYAYYDTHQVGKTALELFAPKGER